MRLDETDEDNTAGLDLAAVIRQRWPLTKTIIITGYGTPERLQTGDGTRISRDIGLPMNMSPRLETEDLVQVVQRVLAQYDVPERTELHDTAGVFSWWTISPMCV